MRQIKKMQIKTGKLKIHSIQTIFAYRQPTYYDLHFLSEIITEKLHSFFQIANYLTIQQVVLLLY